MQNPNNLFIFSLFSRNPTPPPLYIIAICSGCCLPRLFSITVDIVKETTSTAPSTSIFSLLFMVRRHWIHLSLPLVVSNCCHCSFLLNFEVGTIYSTYFQCGFLDRFSYCHCSFILQIDAVDSNMPLTPTVFATRRSIQALYKFSASPIVAIGCFDFPFTAVVFRLISLFWWNWFLVWCLFSNSSLVFAGFWWIF